ncbi:coiled-coil domain-containing protein 40 isoform X2 [Agrilus planipennis]|uniref:Coiled-coil domain-containing protein 40 isoform X1 n=1 Tax=Agrilus planipennis TaxID=224129 RepID=A0A1W4XBB7_AGRPL|nr:coiled-coil domain-containing protein 40 isoform X1 [Agrilus planipennis]XP_025829434.1 coiled-coil domain-containing protein 40 isoform X2 [Agrilus planipennis]
MSVSGDSENKDKGQVKTLRFIEVTDVNDDDEQSQIGEEEEESLECMWPEQEEETVEEEEQDVTEETLLSPDNPLLEKFQKALKEHLLKQIETIKSEVFELESGTKKLNVEREKLGVEVYEIQQQLNKQQEELKLCEEQLQNVIAAKDQVEHDLQIAINEYKETKAKLHEAEREEIGLRRELEAVDLLHQQMSTWEETVESELAVNQRIFEKSRKDKLKAAAEKREQDGFIYKLMKEIWRLEGEIETMDMQIRVKEEEREKLADEIALANVDLETFNNEHKCLMQSWNSLLVAINYRDKVYNSMENELEKKSEKLRAILAEIDAVKKLGVREMQRSEELSIFKDRVVQDIVNYSKRLDLEYKKKFEIDDQIALLKRIIEQTEKDVDLIKAENAEKGQVDANLQRDIEAIDLQKGELDNQILAVLEEQITNDKASKYLQKLLREIKDKNRDLEVSLANSENLNAKVLMEVETQKFLIEKIQQTINEVEKEQTSYDAEIKANKTLVTEIEGQFLKKRREINILTKKIETIMQQTGGVEVSPLELKIQTLEKNLVDINEDIKQLERYWLREQAYIVGLTQKRQNQLRDINVMKKQIMLLTQKNLTIGDELEAYKKESDKIEKNTTIMLNRLTTLNEKNNNLRGNKYNLDKDVIFKQNEYIGQLETAEMELLNLESDCTEIEKEKQTISEELIEANRESLVWEKRLIMVLQLKKQIKEEQAEGGEVGTMKFEIHRMQVRLGQLKKAQDKLLHDLQHCLSRREAIVNTAEAREKRTKGAVDQTRMNFERKLEETRLRHKEIQKEIEEVAADLNKAELEVELSRKQIQQIEKEVEEIKQRIERTKHDVEIAETENEKSLGITLTKQKKLGFYIDLSKGKQPYILYCSDKTINPELEKQKELNSILITVVQKTFVDFPERYQHFLRIYNTLIIPTMYL